MSKSQGRRHTFDQVAALYDSARPLYPEALFDDIVSYAKLSAIARILELGCGTCQATLPMAQRGFHIDGIELGAQLAEIARANLAAFPNVRIFCADFETTDLPSASYDLLLSATAFHARFGGAIIRETVALLYLARRD